jgi:polysaccharide deacetylase 2 family uncharacterized protein YibQ
MTPKLPPQGKEIQPNPVIIYLILILLAATTVLGLDYLNWTQEDKSFIFSSILGKKTPAEPVPSDQLFELTRKIIQKQDLPNDAISHYRDEEGFYHIMLKLNPEDFSRLSRELQDAWEQYPASMTTESRSHDKGMQYTLWKAESPARETLYVLFLIQPAAESEVGTAPSSNGRVALIIDDLGYSLQSIQRVTELKQKITVAVLPYTPLARETARIAQRNNLEVILHLPLESLNNNYDNNHTEGLVHSGMNPAEISASVDESIKRVPYIKGVNTHMGSKITQDYALMKVILNRIKPRQLYFIDSRTTSNSVAFAAARELGIPSARRHVFLDGEINKSYIKNQFIKLLNAAISNGYAVGICHPYPETLDTLKNNFYLVREYGLQAVFASEIVE